MTDSIPIERSSTSFQDHHHSHESSLQFSSSLSSSSSSPMPSSSSIPIPLSSSSSSLSNQSTKTKQLSNHNHNQQPQKHSQKKKKQNNNQPRTILTEEQYTQLLSSIITRDYYPTLPSLQRDTIVSECRANGDIYGAVKARRQYRNYVKKELERLNRDERLEEEAVVQAVVMEGNNNISDTTNTNTTITNINNSSSSKSNKVVHRNIGIRNKPRPLHRETITGFHERVTSEDNEEFQRTMMEEQSKHMERMKDIYDLTLVDGCGGSGVSVVSMMNKKKDMEKKDMTGIISGDMAMIGEMEFASDEFTASAIYAKMGGSKIMSQQNHLMLPQSSSSLSSSLILNDDDNTNSNNHINIKSSHNNNNSAKAERTTPYDRNSLFFVPDHHQTPVDDDQDNCYHCENGNNTNDGRDSSVINTATANITIPTSSLSSSSTTKPTTSAMMMPPPPKRPKRNVDDNNQQPLTTSTSSSNSAATSIIKFQQRRDNHGHLINIPRHKLVEYIRKPNDNDRAVKRIVPSATRFPGRIESSLLSSSLSSTTIRNRHSNDGILSTCDTDDDGNVTSTTNDTTTDLDETSLRSLEVERRKRKEYVIKDCQRYVSMTSPSIKVKCNNTHEKQKGKRTSSSSSSHRRRRRNHSSSSSIISSSSSISSMASLSSKMSTKTSSSLSSLSTIADLSPAARRLLHSVLPEGIPMGWSSGNNNNSGSISLSTRSRSVSSKSRSRSKTRSKSLSTTSTTNISARSGSALGSALRASYCGVSVNNGGGIMDGLKGGIITTTNKSTPKKQRQRSVDSTTAK